MPTFCSYFLSLERGCVAEEAGRLRRYYVAEFEFTGSAPNKRPDPRFRYADLCRSILMFSVLCSIKLQHGGMLHNAAMSCQLLLLSKQWPGEDPEPCEVAGRALSIASLFVIIIISGQNAFPPPALKRL